MCKHGTVKPTNVKIRNKFGEKDGKFGIIKIYGNHTVYTDECIS
jgi:hypothetical protein